ncbi:MAG: extracellular solute-binding protein, partial [Pseudomonadota bacterium]
MYATKSVTALALASATLLAPAFAAAEGVLNLYSSRHYDTDERLYSDFEEATGIKINRIEGKADELIARMKSEGANSPADILLTVDTSRLERAKSEGVLQSITSPVLEARIPSYLQDDENQWYGFSQRARILFYDKNDVKDPPMNYQDLADPKYKGMVCSRSGTNVYSQTIMAALIEHLGADTAKGWAEGVVANFA